MRVSTADIQRLAERIIEAVLQQGYVKAKGEKSALSRRVAELIQKNLAEEVALEADAERLAQQHIRRSAGGAGVDERRVIEMIKKKLAEERGFSL